MRELLFAGTVALGAGVAFSSTPPQTAVTTARSTASHAFSRILDLDDIEAMALANDPDVARGLADVAADRLVSFEEVFGEPF